MVARAFSKYYINPENINILTRNKFSFSIFQNVRIVENSPYKGLHVLEINWIGCWAILPNFKLNCGILKSFSTKFIPKTPVKYERFIEHSFYFHAKHEYINSWIHMEWIQKWKWHCWKNLNLRNWEEAIRATSLKDRLHIACE